ncbi:MAG: phosphoserine transaminase [Planctomycetota bacterium]
MGRTHNFNAGPGALPQEVLEQAQAELLDFRGSGISLLASSHRGPEYSAVHAETIQSLRELIGGTEDHDILFMGGGARTQFVLVAWNLLQDGQHGDYLVTGNWSETAVAEASKIGDVRTVWSAESAGFTRVPNPGDYAVDPAAAYLHYTSNNTIRGTQYPAPPDSGDVPLVCDMSSDILSRPVHCQDHDLIYAGAQKNLGPAGVTVVIVRRSLLERMRTDLPGIFSYRTFAKKDSLLNTPPVFAIYLVGLTAKHWLERGGLAPLAEANARKARRLYETIDGSDGFYACPVEPASRSAMNVVFRMRDAALEARFLEESKAHGFVGLKGHRSVGGLRASLYNAVPESSVEALCDFLDDFRSRSA